MLTMSVSLLALGVYTQDVKCGTTKVKNGEREWFDCTAGFSNVGDRTWKIGLYMVSVSIPNPFCDSVPLSIDGGEALTVKDGSQRLFGGQDETTHDGSGAWVANSGSCDAVVTVETHYFTDEPPFTPAPTSFTPAPTSITPAPAPKGCGETDGPVVVTGCRNTLHYPVGVTFTLCDPCMMEALGPAEVTRIGTTDRYLATAKVLGFDKAEVKCGDVKSSGPYTFEVLCSSSGGDGLSGGAVGGIVVAVLFVAAAAGVGVFLLYRKRARASQEQEYERPVNEEQRSYATLKVQ